ncbi:MAG TPA: CoA ester lyase, partial [Gammaproteobacteria bacterium]|nr:CoA ester lyase [Gammaproteobacteria bacterium]
VDAARKDAARESAGEFLRDRSSIRARTLWLRINGVGDRHFAADVAAAVRAQVDGIVLPKPRSARDVLALAAQLDVLETQMNRPLGATTILPIATETASSVLGLREYANCGPRLAALTWGAEDLSAALGAETAVDERGAWLPPYELARSLCLLAAGAAEVPAIDTVHTDVRDLAGLRRSALAAHRDGFAGKLAIHPDQVPLLNEAFRPTAAAVEAAQAIVTAFAAAGGAGVVASGGKMLDRPHLLRAQRVLALAAASDAVEPAEGNDFPIG